MENSSEKASALKLVTLMLLSTALGASVTYLLCENYRNRILTEFAADVELRDSKRAQQELELMRQKRYSCVQQFLRTRAKLSPESVLASELNVAIGRLSQETFDMIKQQQTENEDFLKTFTESEFDC